MAKRRKRKLFVRLVVFLIIVGLFFFSAHMSYNYVLKSQKVRNELNISEITPENGIEIEIPVGSNTGSIAEILKEKGIIKYPVIFKIISRINGFDGTYTSGIHIIRRGVNYNSLLGYEELMTIMSSNPVATPAIRVTIPEGYTYSQIVNLLAQKGIIDKEEFNKEANEGNFEYEFVKEIPPERNPRLEGYLFPDTYIFDERAGEHAAINKMLQNFNNKFKPEYYERAKQLGMTIDDIIILASIIEREAKVSEDRDIIAGVFYNRLNNKDKTLRKLQSCATIQYIYFNEHGKVKEEITEQDTKIQDPYNTYLHEGLPPGPICCPGEDSIKSALYPEDTDYLYFVAGKDGKHIFSKTYDEHINAMNSLNNE